MLPLGVIGIDADELDTFEAGLTSHQSQRTVVHVQTMDRVPVDTITLATDGQVNLASDRDVTRTLQLSMLDPAKSVDLGPPNGLGFDRMLQVVRRMYLPALGRTLEFPVFTGPITHYERAGTTVDIECQGLEQRANTDVATLVVKRGAHVVDAIRTILSDRCGETRFAFPSTASVSARLAKDVTVGEDQEVWPWPVCTKLADSIGHQLFYDARGVAVLRVAPTHPVFTLTSDGSNATITEPLSVTHDITDAYNRVKVTGKKGHTVKKGDTTKRVPGLVAVAVPPADHPLSPRSPAGPDAAGLGRNGVPFRRTLLVDAPHVSSRKQLQAMADLRLSRQLALGNGMTFSAVPVWHLDVLDPLRIETEAFSGTYVLDQASIPLVSGEMSLGFQKVVHHRAAKARPPKRHKRQPHRRRHHA